MSSINWQSFATPTDEKIIRFKRELFSDIVRDMWKMYEEDRDENHFTCAFLTFLDDFPDMKYLFDKYYRSFSVDDNYNWSDKNIIMGFLTKMVIIYENFEVTK